MKNLIKILLLILILFSPKHALSAYHGNDYYAKIIDYRLIDENKIAQEADAQLIEARDCESPEERKKIFELAAGKYYLLTKINPANINAHIYLGYIYGELNKERLAKEFLYRAYNIDPNNSMMHYYFGEFHYRNKDYRKALASYLNAYNNGMYDVYELNLKIGTIYEKFGDLRMAKRFYEYAAYINGEDEALAEKIRLLDELNFEDSPYYSKQRLQLRN